MLSDRIATGYFEWMYNLVCDGISDRSYVQLFHTLNQVEFTWIIPMDASRAEDGRNMRYIYAYESEIPSTVISENFQGIPCSVLEMMLALAIRCEKSIMDNTEYGDRTSQWFWGMIANLGLGSMSDDHFDSVYVTNVLNRFLNRSYMKDGTGGLFRIHDDSKDMRQIDIWYQMCFYLNEILGMDS